MKVAMFILMLTRAFAVMGVFYVLSLTFLILMSTHCALSERLESRFGH